MEEFDPFSLFYYDENSPSCLRSKIDRFRGKHNKALYIKAGDVVGHKDQNGYWIITYKRKRRKAHRIVWELYYGEIDESLFIDHLDGNPSNNRIENLRLVTRKINARNALHNGRSFSGVVGVTFQQSSKYSAWVAGAYGLDGRLVRRVFSCQKYGYGTALEMAISCRKQMIEELNKQGAGYTERHSKGEQND